MGRFLRDLAEGAIAGAIAAVLALQLDVTTPQAILFAALTGAVAAIIAVARRTIAERAGKAPAPGADGRP